MHINILLYFKYLLVGIQRERKLKLNIRTLTIGQEKIAY